MSEAPPARAEYDVEVSVVVPCHNEEDVLASTHTALVAALTASAASFEIVYVDDGSRDRTAHLIRELHAADPRAKFLILSRNFGQAAAVAAGMEFSTGRAVVIIDADLQDPPELFGEMLRLWREGYDVVYGRRIGREGESFTKLITARIFYRLFRRLSRFDAPVDVGDFRIMDRRVVNALRRLGEQDRYMRGLVSWTGFRQIGVDYNRRPRTAGVTKYSATRMMRVASDALFSFSLAPLRAAIWIGLLAASIALAGILYAIALRLLTSIWVSGWTLLFVSVAFLGGIQLVFLGVLGEYIGRIFLEVKRRPLYLVADAGGLGEEGDPRVSRRAQ